MRVLSLCCGMGLFDRAFLDHGFTVVPGCELDPDQSSLYRLLVGGEPLTHDIHDLPALLSRGDFDGVIGGPPASHTRRFGPCGRRSSPT